MRQPIFITTPNYVDTVGDLLDWIEENDIPRSATISDTGFETDGRYSAEWAIEVEGPEWPSDPWLRLLAKQGLPLDTPRQPKPGYVTFQIRRNRG